MGNKLKVINDEGFEEEIEVISFYELPEYNHEYVLYTKGEEEGDNIVSYISIIEEVAPKEYKFKRIEDKEEEKKISKIIEEEINKY